MKKIVRGFLFLFLFGLLSFKAFAGFAGGPYVIWVNLSGDASVDIILKEKIACQDDCLPADVEFFFKSRPDGLTDDLIKAAIFRNNKNAIKKIDKLLRKPYKNLRAGFDGLMVFDSSKTAKLFSTEVGWLMFASEEIHDGITSDNSWGKFCTMIPSITRKP